MELDTHEQLYTQLPIEARNLLDFQTPKVRKNCLTLIGHLITEWSDSGANLDPIQWDLILNGLTEVLAKLSAELRDEQNLVTMMLGAE